jgi:hypothetical protein
MLVDGTIIFENLSLFFNLQLAVLFKILVKFNLNTFDLITIFLQFIISIDVYFHSLNNSSGNVVIVGWATNNCGVYIICPSLKLLLLWLQNISESLIGFAELLSLLLFLKQSQMGLLRLFDHSS